MLHAILVIVRHALDVLQSSLFAFVSDGSGEARRFGNVEDGWPTIGYRGPACDVGRGLGFVVEAEGASLKHNMVA